MHPGRGDALAIGVALLAVAVALLAVAVGAAILAQGLRLRGAGALADGLAGGDAVAVAEQLIDDVGDGVAGIALLIAVARVGLLLLRIGVGLLVGLLLIGLLRVGCRIGLRIILRGGRHRGAGEQDGSAKRLNESDHGKPPSFLPEPPKSLEQ